MLCLHGKPAVLSTTERGTYWTCGEPSRCFTCSRAQKQLYDKAIKAFLGTKQDRPRCCGIVPASQLADVERYCSERAKNTHVIDDMDTKATKGYVHPRPCLSAADVERRYAIFRVYTGKEWPIDFKEENIGRPFFTCEKCGYFKWGDKKIITKPLCHHGMICTVNGKCGDRSYFGCPKRNDGLGCGYFEWADPPNEGPAQKKRRLERLSRLSKEDRENPWLSY